MSTGCPCELVQRAVVVGVAQRAVGLIEGGLYHWRRRSGGVGGMVVKAGFVGAGEGEREKEMDDQKTAPAVVEECRGLDLCELAL